MSPDYAVSGIDSNTASTDSQGSITQRPNQYTHVFSDSGQRVQVRVRIYTRLIFPTALLPA